MPLTTIEAIFFLEVRCTSLIHRREGELRALIWTPQNGKNDIVNPENNKYKDVFVLYVTIDLEKLIERIFVSPSAPSWFFELIQTVTTKFELKKELVKQSNLASTPIY